MPPEAILLLEGSCLKARRVAHLGFALCLLPSSMVVLQSHVLYFQDLPSSPQWVGLTSGSGGHDCWFHLREYNCGELSGCLGKCDQSSRNFPSRLTCANLPTPCTPRPWPNWEITYEASHLRRTVFWSRCRPLIACVADETKPQYSPSAK